MKKETTNILTMAIGAGAIGYSIWLTLKMKALANDLGVELNCLTDELTEEIRDRISDNTVARAIDAASAKEVQEALAQSRRIAIESSKAAIRDYSRAEVQKVWNENKDSVLSAIRREVDGMDIDDLKKEAVKEAKSEMLDKVLDAVSEAISDTRDKYDDKLEEYLDDLDDRYEQKLKEKIDASTIRINF